MKMRISSLLTLLGTTTAFACSLINAPEDLLGPEDEETVPGDGDGDGTGGASGDGDGDMGGNPGDGDGDGDVTPPEAPTTGLIVVTGEEAESGDRVLLTLNASNGNERSREPVAALSVAYDEAPDRFAWFILKSTQLDPSANRLAELDVRWYFDDTDTWHTVSTTSALPPPLVRGNLGVNPGPNPTAVLRPVVLNERLAYISQIVDGGDPVPAVTILDTSDLTNVTVQESIPIPEGDNVLGLVGRRGTELNPNAVGGSISVMVGRTCDAEMPPECTLVALPITVGNNVSELASNDFGLFQGIPAFASTPVLPASVDRPFEDVIDSLGAYALSFDPVTGDPRWWQFDPADPASKATPSSLPDSTSTTFNGFAVSECLAAGVAADAGVEKLTGVHLANGDVLDLSPALGDMGADVIIEPFQGNAVVLRSAGADHPAVRAFQIETIGSGASQQISLAERSVWNAPEDVDPISIAVRLPEVPTCD